MLVATHSGGCIRQEGEGVRVDERVSAAIRGFIGHIANANPDLGI